MEENKNNVPVKAEIVEGKKKKHTARNIIIGVVVLFVVIGLLPDSDKESTPAASDTREIQQETQAEDFEETEASKEEETVGEDDTEKTASDVDSEEDDKITESKASVDESEIDAISPGNPDYKKYIHVGESYKLVNGGSMEILDAGYGYGVIYILVEFTSGEDDSLHYTQYDATLYVDDYEVPIGAEETTAIENGYVFVDGSASYPTEVSINAGGRKGKIVFVSDIPDNVSGTADIEFEIAGGIFKVNPASTIHAQDKINEFLGRNDEPEYTGLGAYGISYGTYEGTDMYDEGYNEAFIGYYTDEEGGDYIMIDHHDIDNDAGMPDNFSGTIKENGDSCAVYDNSGTVVFYIYKESDGIVIEVADPNYREGISKFAGRYDFIEGLGEVS